MTFAQYNLAPVVILTAGGQNPNVMIHALSQHFPNLHVIFEQPEGKFDILKRRRRHVGLLNATGQLATMAVSKFTKKLSSARAIDILAQFNLTDDVPPFVRTYSVETINDEQTLGLIGSIAPSAILTISCRLLSKASLAQMPCPVINFHAGINPTYRGQMGGYWALVEKDAANFGATVHLVDAGVDTGAMLYEQRVTPSKSDSIATYPLLLTAVSTGITIQAIEDALTASLTPRKPKPAPSKLRFPPTIWQWIYNGITKGVW